MGDLAVKPTEEAERERKGERERERERERIIRVSTLRNSIKICHQAYLWWTNKLRPCIRLYYDTITYCPLETWTEREGEYPGLVHNEGTYEQRYHRTHTHVLFAY
jgi:hypothetical protein